MFSSETKTYIMKLFSACMLSASVIFISCGQNTTNKNEATSTHIKTEIKLENTDYVWDGTRVEKTSDEWKAQLSEQSFYVTRQQGTDRSFSGIYADHHEDGIYYCVCCGLPLFDSKTKFVSGTGWPSFYQPINEKNIGKTTDYEIGYARTEIHCARCDAHLGHVFDDAADQPTGLRYCMNSSSLIFKKR